MKTRSRASAVRALGLAALVLAASGTAGCGSADRVADSARGAPDASPNGVSGATPQEAVAMSRRALADADSVTIHGTAKQTGAGSAQVDLRVNRAGGEGTIGLAGVKFDILRSGQDVYVKGTPALYARIGVTSEVPAGAWVKLPTNSPVGRYTELAAEAGRIIATSGRLSKGSVTTVGGQPALELKTQGRLYKGRLYLKSTGEPLPLKLEKHGRETSTFTFTDWNSTPAPAAPTKTIDAGG